MSDSVSFGAWLRQRRKERDLTQAKLGEQVGCSKETIRKIEADMLKPSAEFAKHLVAFFDVPLAERPALVQLARRGGGAQNGAIRAPLGKPEQILSPQPTNLPAAATSFIGRASEMRAVCANLRRDSVRLLTLTGAPGIGKTRLGLQVGRALLNDFAGGVFFVPLGSVVDPGLVGVAIAQVLGVREALGQPLTSMLKDYLRNKQLLLLLDNFEQVLDAALLISDLLTAAPHLKILVTSRAVLHVYGEHEFLVPPLTLPNPQLPLPLDRWTEYEALALFAQRAQAGRPDFTISDQNGAAVIEICARLDGIPLAIELAATRSKWLEPQDIAARLGDRMALLRADARDLPARQQTLRGAIDWSYQLLTSDTQRLFARLAVFAGGCTLAAAEAVTGAAPSDLATLVNHSLLGQYATVGEEIRFVQLETIREYAWERLVASREALELQRRYAQYYLQQVEEAEPQLRGLQQEMALRQLEREYDNLRAAVRWAVEHREVTLALRLCATLWRFWYLHGDWSEGRRWLDQALTLLSSEESTIRQYAHSVPHSILAQALHGAGLLADAQGDHEAAITLYRQSLALCREIGDRWRTAMLLNNLGHTALCQGDFSVAAELLEEALVLQRELGDKWGIAIVLSNLWQTALEQGAVDRARALVEESLALRRELGDTHGTAGSLMSLGLLALRQGDHRLAETAWRESLDLYEQLGSKGSIAQALTHLGYLAQDCGNRRQAVVLYRKSLSLYEELRDRDGIAVTLYNLGQATYQDDPQKATTLFAESLELNRELGRKSTIVSCLEGFAAVASAMKQPERAARLFAAAVAQRQLLGTARPSSDQGRYEQSVATARRQLDEPTWRAEWAAGQALSLEQAVSYATEQIHHQSVFAT